MSLTLGKLFDTAGDDKSAETDPIDPIELANNQALLDGLAAKFKLSSVCQQSEQSE